MFCKTSAAVKEPNKCGRDVEIPQSKNPACVITGRKCDNEVDRTRSQVLLRALFRL